MTAEIPAIIRRTPTRTIKALIGGRWYGELAETEANRKALADAVQFRDIVSAAPEAKYPAEPGRYHLYVSYACPWAHRTIIYRKLKGLEDVISMSVLHPRWAGPDGWRFADSPVSTVDHVGNRRTLHEVYQAADPVYTGKVSVPVLWDRVTGKIVNNQSGDIIRMFNSEFDAWGKPGVDFYPEELREDIDRTNAWLLPDICGAVYRAGFASSQSAYEDAIDTLFAGLDKAEQRLRDRPYLNGNRITESDWHLFATLCRFDAVYYGALKCNQRRLSDYPALTAFTARLQRETGVSETVRFDHMKQHYYDAIGVIEPRIVPRGPEIEYLKQPAGANDRPVPQRSSVSENDFVAEIVDLHKYLGQWLRGEITGDPAGPARLREALSDSFTVVHPNGLQEGKAAVLANFDAAYGEKADGYSLEVSDIVVNVLEGGYCFASYRESHVPDVGRTRLCSALLRRRANADRIEWLHLQETFVSNSASESRFDATPAA